MPIPQNPNQGYPPYPPIPPSNPSSGPVATGGGVYNPLSNGQVFARNYNPFYPCLNLTTGLTEYRTFDVSVPFNDPVLPSYYFFKVEEVMAYRNPTLRSIIATYLDMGIVNTIWTLTCSEDDQTVSQQISVKVLGNAIPTLRLMAQRIDFILTGQLVQLSVYRPANGGVLALAKVVIGLDVEKSTL
jgi:hypothetical protein